MFLKRLEIQGFKSFNERMEIEFGPGITVIVGPNGCGKSNLTEAVQWALGEQNARALRGYRMEDVIFAGTTRRRSYGMAEVSLVFDNTGGDLPLEYQEVAITRRVYRSGEGEYFINRTPCRLRDIQELFISCGISRAAFSIIAQGKIEEFISQKPEERRLYLEEMAGIGKYRQRKVDAVKKLGETEDVLVRLQDVTGELDRQLAPLAEQARTATLYNECQEKLRSLETLLIRSQFARAAARKSALAAAIENLCSSSASAQQKAVLLAEELKALEAGLKERKDRIDACETQCGQVQRQLQEVRIQSARMQEKYSSSQSRQSELNVRLQVISQKDQELALEMREITRQHEGCLDKKALAGQHCLSLEETIETWQERRRQANDQWEKNNGELFEALHQKTILTSLIRELQNKKDAARRQQENLRHKSFENTTRIERIKEQIEEKNGLVKARAVKSEEIAAELARVRQRADAVSGEQSQIVPAIQRLLQENEHSKTRLHMLQESEKNSDGYRGGVRAIMQARARGESCCKGILGLVEELFTIDREFETALYTAIGRAAHYFVCDSPETAQRTLAYLKGKETGRASFLPLTALRRWLEKERRPRYVNLSDVLGRGADLVACAEEYRNVAEYLLGRTFFANNLGPARQFAESNYYRVRVVTLDGDLIQPGGLITGGREAKTVQFAIKRKQEIAQLSGELNRGRQALEELERRHTAAAAEKVSLDTRIRELEALLNSLEKERNTLEQEISSLTGELRQFDEFTQVWLLEGNEENYRSEGLDQEIEHNGLELAAVQERELGLEQQRARIELEKKECEEKLHELNAQLSDSRVQLVSLNQEIKYLEQKKQQVNNLIEEQRLDGGKVRAGQDELLAETAGFDEQIGYYRAQIETLEKRKEGIESDLEFRRKQIGAKENYYRAKEKRYLRVKQLGWQREQKAHSLEVQAQHLVEQMDEIGARALELELTVDEARGSEMSRQEEAAVKEQAASLRDKLGGYGEINFAAPGEYAALKDRCGFLAQQKEDLEDGRQALLAVIREMDQIVATRFHQTFEEVKHNFEAVFSILFDGGTAELFLTAEKDLMNTGIDVKVLPRGKKPRHLSLLSGGEKALTGICFLFALLQTRPSPFYFLDEIEAFLDESNLNRFADFLCMMSKKSQIILVSHRPRTMQAADALYGVTMEEPGISRLVAVELEEPKVALVEPQPH